jgi:hypothetical protein
VGSSFAPAVVQVRGRGFSCGRLGRFADASGVEPGFKVDQAVAGAIWGKPGLWWCLTARFQSVPGAGRHAGKRDGGRSVNDTHRFKFKIHGGPLECGDALARRVQGVSLFAVNCTQHRRHRRHCCRCFFAANEIRYLLAAGCPQNSVVADVQRGDAMLFTIVHQPLVDQLTQALIW